MESTAHRRHARRGFTLIELVIALSIVALLAATAVMTVNSVTDAKLRSSSLSISGAIKQNYDRAAMLRRTQRMVFDIDNNVWWVEYTENRFALSRERKAGDEGESVEEARERLAEAAEKKESGFFDEEEREKAEVTALVENGGSMYFSPDADLEAGEPQKLPGGVGFSRIWTGHQEEPFKAGMAHLHFFPNGWTEPAMIELEDENGSFFTLKVQPLTGRVKSYDKRLEDDPEVDEDDGYEEGDL